MIPAPSSPVAFPAADVLRLIATTMHTEVRERTDRGETEGVAAVIACLNNVENAIRMAVGCIERGLPSPLTATDETPA